MSRRSHHPPISFCQKPVSLYELATDVFFLVAVVSAFVGIVYLALAARAV